MGTHGEAASNRTMGPPSAPIAADSKLGPTDVYNNSPVNKDTERTKRRREERKRRELEEKVKEERSGRGMEGRRREEEGS